MVVDGHTRLAAAKQAALAEVPVVYREFADEDAALDYAIHAQRDRRNLTDADILHLVEQLDKRRQRGGDRRSPNAGSKTSGEVSDRSSDETAKRIGVSATKVENARAVLDSGNAVLRKAVESGGKSLNRASGEARTAKRVAGKGAQQDDGAGTGAPPARQATKAATAKATAALAEVLAIL